MIRASSTSSRPLNCDAARTMWEPGGPIPQAGIRSRLLALASPFSRLPTIPVTDESEPFPSRHVAKERKELIRVYFRRLVPVFTNHPELNVFQKARREVLTLSARDGIYNWLRNWLRTRNSNPEPCG